MKLASLKRKAVTAWRLGPMNVARATVYRAQVRAGRGATAIVPPPVPHGPFFAAAARVGDCPTPPPLTVRHFGWQDPPLRADGRPDWFFSAFTSQRVAHPTEPWFRLSDFDPALGDIKFIWEWSRFDWIIRCAQHMRATGDVEAHAKLNDWLTDWLTHNPPYAGPNWKCGQEASIRILHLYVAAHVLGAVKSPTESLVALVRMHLQRIAPTVSYAIAQDNNHGASEGAGLFIGGTWLAAVRPDDAFAAECARAGRRLLENRAARLILADGTFSQYSVNYHRMALDPMVMSEFARRDLDAPPFTPHYRERLAAATRWLHAFVDPQSGDAPLIGANDGGRLVPLLDGYRDFRPSLVRAAALFLDERVLPPGPYDDELRWLGLSASAIPAAPLASQHFDAGGFAVLRRDYARAIIRYPNFRFRPSQADALHVDLWIGSTNVLPDAGTFSYNFDEATLGYFSGTASHNTIQFDDRDQMPRLSRFLYADWLSARDVTFAAPAEGAHSFQAGYTDAQGAMHTRHVALDGARLVVTDTIAGFRDKAVLRWRLGSGVAHMSGLTAHNAFNDGTRLDVTVEATSDVRRAGLVRGEISSHYGRREAIEVIEIEVGAPTTLVSTFRWQRPQPAA